MKASSILAVLALVCTSSTNAIGHHDHAMAFYSAHPEKIPSSHAQRNELPNEPVSEEQAVEAAKLGQQDFVQLMVSSSLNTELDIATDKQVNYAMDQYKNSHNMF